MAERGETVASLEFFHNSSSSIPLAAVFLLLSPNLLLHNTHPFLFYSFWEISNTSLRGDVRGRSVTSVRLLPWLTDVAAPCLTDGTCILCHSSILAGALVRQHAEHPKANHSGSVIWVTESSSAPISSPTLQQALTLVWAAKNSASSCYIYQKPTFVRGVTSHAAGVAGGTNVSDISVILKLKRGTLKCNATNPQQYCSESFRHQNLHPRTPEPLEAEQFSNNNNKSSNLSNNLANIHYIIYNLSVHGWWRCI